MEAVAQEETPETDLRQFFEDYEKEGLDAVLPQGVYTLADLRDWQEEGLVSAFPRQAHDRLRQRGGVQLSILARPKVSSLVSRELEKECVVVFDEAHNIDTKDRGAEA